MKLSKNGSIYKLANFDSQLPKNTDLCTLSKRVVVGFLLAIMLSITMAIIIMIPGTLIFHVVMYMITGIFLATEALIGVSSVLLLTTFALILYYGYKGITYTGKEAIKGLETFEVIKMYKKSLKEKICFLVEVE